MKHAQFLLKFCSNKPSTCSLEPQYLDDLKSRPCSPECYRLQNPWGSDLEMREVIIPSARTQSCSSYTTSGRDQLCGTGSILLENNSTFSEYCIKSGNQLVLQQVQLHMLIHLNPLFLPVNPTHPPQSGPGVNGTHTCFHSFCVSFVHLLCFYECRLSKMGSGH